MVLGLAPKNHWVNFFVYLLWFTKFYQIFLDTCLHLLNSFVTLFFSSDQKETNITTYLVFNLKFKISDDHLY